MSLFRLTFSWFVFSTNMINTERKIAQSEIKKKRKRKRGEATNQTQTVKVSNTLFKSLEAQKEQTGSVTRNKASKKINK